MQNKNSWWMFVSFIITPTSILIQTLVQKIFWNKPLFHQVWCGHVWQPWQLIIFCVSVPRALYDGETKTRDWWGIVPVQWTWIVLLAFSFPFSPSMHRFPSMALRKGIYWKISAKYLQTGYRFFWISFCWYVMFLEIQYSCTGVDVFTFLLSLMVLKIAYAIFLWIYPQGIINFKRGTDLDIIKTGIYSRPRNYKFQCDLHKISEVNLSAFIYRTVSGRSLFNRQNKYSTALSTLPRVIPVHIWIYWDLLNTMINVICDPRKSFLTPGRSRV